MTKSELGGMQCRNDYCPHVAPIKHCGFFVDLFSALQNNGTGNLSVDLFHDLVRKIVSDLLSDLLSKYTHDVSPFCLPIDGRHLSPGGFKLMVVQRDRQIIHCGIE